MIQHDKTPHEDARADDGDHDRYGIVVKPLSPLLLLAFPEFSLAFQFV
jgi:hypothetical protein